MKPSPPTSLPAYFTLGQIAARWQMSVKTVRRLIARRELVAHHFGEQLRVSVEDLLAYEKGRRD